MPRYSLPYLKYVIIFKIPRRVSVNLLLEVVYQYRCVGNVAENQNASFHPGDDAFPEKIPNSQSRMLDPTSTHKSKLVMPVRRSGVMEAEQPSTKNILKRLLPMTFPMAISGFSSRRLRWRWRVRVMKCRLLRA